MSEIFLYERQYNTDKKLNIFIWFTEAIPPSEVGGGFEYFHTASSSIQVRYKFF